VWWVRGGVRPDGHQAILLHFVHKLAGAAGHDSLVFLLKKKRHCSVVQIPHASKAVCLLLSAHIKNVPRDVNYLCGERGIRTLEELSPLTVFKTAAFNHSAISPVARYYQKKRELYTSVDPVHGTIFPNGTDTTKYHLGSSRASPCRKR
jgi:hypothetical protein